MISDLDILRVAHLMMHEFGGDAELEAETASIACAAEATGTHCSPGQESSGLSPCWI
jgi:hypothetical protein